jgi:hypothetical protein
MSVVRAVARASRHVAKSQTNINISISIRLFIDVSGLNLLDSVQAAATLLNTPYSNVLRDLHHLIASPLSSTLYLCNHREFSAESNQPVHVQYMATYSTAGQRDLFYSSSQR